MKKVRKAIIPAAGLGTRFLPATKTVPKEMLPLVDKPTIYYIVEEIQRAGIEDLVIIAGRGKTAIEDFFDVSYEVQDKLAKDGKEELLNKVLEVQNMVNVISVRQMKPLGLGHAVHCGKKIVGDEPFAVLLGDEVMISEAHQKTATQTLTESFNQTQLSSVAVMEVAQEDVKKYGIIDGEPQADGALRIRSVIEKPSVEEAPSRFALPGRYVFDAEIFKYLENAKPGKNGEIQLTDAMTQLAQSKGMLGLEVEAKRYDAGDKLGYLIANIELGLKHPETSEGLLSYLNSKGWTQ